MKSLIFLNVFAEYCFFVDIIFEQEEKEDVVCCVFRSACDEWAEVVGEVCPLMSGLVAEMDITRNDFRWIWGSASAVLALEARGGNDIS